MTVVYLKKSFRQKECVYTMRLFPGVTNVWGRLRFVHSLEQLTGKVTKEKSIGCPQTDSLDKLLRVR